MDGRRTSLPFDLNEEQEPGRISSRRNSLRSSSSSSLPFEDEAVAGETQPLALKSSRMPPSSSSSSSRHELVDKSSITLATTNVASSPPTVPVRVVTPERSPSSPSSSRRGRATSKTRRGRDRRWRDSGSVSSGRRSPSRGSSVGSTRSVESAGVAAARSANRPWKRTDSDLSDNSGGGSSTASRRSAPPPPPSSAFQHRHVQQQTQAQQQQPPQPVPLLTPSPPSQEERMSRSTSFRGERDLSVPPPPAIASSADRWAEPENIAEEALKANAAAVAAAAESAARKESSTPIQKERKGGKDVLILKLSGDEDDKNNVSGDRASSHSPTDNNSRVAKFYNNPERISSQPSFAERLENAGASLPPPPVDTSLGRRGRSATSLGPNDNNDEFGTATSAPSIVSRSLSQGRNILSKMLSSPNQTDRKHLIAQSTDADEEDDEVSFREAPPLDSVRMEALKMLELAEGATSPYALRKTRSGGITATSRDGTVRTKVSGGNSKGNRPWREGRGGADDSAASKKRQPSALAGLDMDEEPRKERDRDLYRVTPSVKDNRFSIDDDEEDLIDVVGMESSLAGLGRSGGRNGRNHSLIDVDDAQDEIPISDEPAQNNKSSWSSRYSVDSQLRAITGGVNTTELLGRMDAEHNASSRKSSATGMFKTSPYEIQKTSSSPSYLGNVGRSNSWIGSGWKSSNSTNTKPHETEDSISFPSGFLFRKSHGYKKSNMTSTSPVIPPSARDRTIWMDVNLRGRGTIPPPPPNMKRRGIIRSVVEEEKRRVTRRRLCVVAVVMTCLAALVGALVVAGNRGGDSADAGTTSGTYEAGDMVTFYVMGNVPFSEQDETELAHELTSLPGDADFVVHLGDVFRADVTKCAESAYEDARAILEVSPKPLFVIPGNNDWNDCPSPDNAWRLWEENLERFEEKYQENVEDFPFVVKHQVERDENFSFLHNGVLFLGIHLVPGAVTDEKWTERHMDNVQWTLENLQDEHRPEDFRAVVIFGHAAPTGMLITEYFDPVVSEVKYLNKPIMYMHASEEDDGVWREYNPFTDADTFMAVQVKDEGSNKLMKVTVNFGSNPFMFERSY